MYFVQTLRPSTILYFISICYEVCCVIANCLSWIPEKGTVGASGDLAPLAHMALGLMGEGRMWSPKTGWDDAKKVLEMHRLKPIKLGPKEVSQPGFLSKFCWNEFLFETDVL